MEANIIPFDVWMGSLVEIGIGRSKFVIGECFTVKRLTTAHGTIPTNENLAAMTKLVGCEYVLGINGSLNTDIPMWPEGIKEDCSNIYTRLVEGGKFETCIIIDIDDIEDNECWKFFNQDTGEYHKLLAFHVEPKFEFFITNDKPNFIDFITRSVAATDIANGMAANCQISKDAPKFRVMKLGEVQMKDMPDYFEPGRLSNAIKTAVVRYFNKVSNDLIHENMLDDIINIRVGQTEDNEEMIMFSIEVLGQIYLFTVEYKPDFELEVEEEAEVEV